MEMWSALPVQSDLYIRYRFWNMWAMIRETPLKGARSVVRSAMCAASQVHGGEQDIAPAP